MPADLAAMRTLLRHTQDVTRYVPTAVHDGRWVDAEQVASGD